MDWQYIRQLLCASWEGVSEGQFVIELILAAIVFFLPGFFKDKEPLQKSGQSVRKILFWKFRNQVEWRLVVSVMMLLTFHIFVLAPYRIYREQKEQERGLVIKTTQWYLVIDSMQVSAVEPNDPVNVSMRLVVSVNGQEYAWPVNSTWCHLPTKQYPPLPGSSPPLLLTNDGTLPKFPLLCGFQTYNVSFSGYIQRHQGTAEFKGGSFDSCSTSNGGKPHTFTMKVTDPSQLEENVTTALIHYHLTND